MPGTYDLAVEIGLERTEESVGFAGAVPFTLTPAACIGIWRCPAHKPGDGKTQAQETGTG